MVDCAAILRLVTHPSRVLLRARTDGQLCRALGGWRVRQRTCWEQANWPSRREVNAAAVSGLNEPQLSVITRQYQFPDPLAELATITIVRCAND